MNLFAVLDQAAARFGERGAVYRGTEQLHSFAELRDRALRLAASVGADRDTGARIAIASENRPEIIELMFAVWAAGCAVVPINFKLHPLEMAQILDDSGAAVVFASPKIAAGLAGVTEVAVEGNIRVLREGSADSTPLFLFHAAGGSSFVYEPLVERLVVANAQQLVIVTSVADPVPRTGFVDRCLAAGVGGDQQQMDHRHAGECVSP